MRREVISVFVCAIVLVSVSASISQNVGEPSSRGGGGLVDSPRPMFRKNPNDTGINLIEANNGNEALKDPSSNLAGGMVCIESLNSDKNEYNVTEIIKTAVEVKRNDVYAFVWEGELIFEVFNSTMNLVYTKAHMVCFVSSPAVQYFSYNFYLIETGEYLVRATLYWDDDSVVDLKEIDIIIIEEQQNQSPIADAGPDQTVYEGEIVQFDGSNSTGSTNGDPPSIDPNVVALYHMNEGSGNSITDETNNQNHGTKYGATWTSSGKFCNALSFDGVDDYVEVPDDPSLDITSEITIEAWIYPRSIDDGLYHRVVDKFYGGTGYALRIEPRGEFSLDVNGWLGSDIALPGNSWSYLVGVSDGTYSSLYLNGQLVKTGKIANPSGSIKANNYPVKIGCWAGGAKSHFDGITDEVVIWNKKLSSQEILDYYNSGMEHFTGSEGGPPCTIESFEWDFESDGIYDYQETPNNAPDGNFDGITEHIYGEDGVYTATLRITDETNQTDTDTCIITVLQVSQPPNADAGPNQTVNEGDSVQFDGSGSVGSHSPAHSVVALWHMNEGSGNVIYDETANHHDGTIIDANWTTQGKFGNALSFDGVDDYIEIKPSDQIFGDNPDEWSYLVWFKTNNNVDDMSIISDFNADEPDPYGDANYTVNLYTKYSNCFGEKALFTGLKCTKVRPSGTQSARYTTSERLNPDNNWQLHVVTVSKTDDAFWWYINGQQNVTTMYLPMKDGDYFDGDMLRIGASWRFDESNTPGSDDIRWHFDGVIDEIVLFDRALSAKEIHYYYNCGREYSLEMDVEYADIISYEWDFESDGIFDYQETPNNAPDGNFDGMTEHIYGNHGEYTATLRITDETNQTDTDTCIITVLQVNQPPIADAGPDQTVNEGDVVQFNGSASYDPDGTIQICEWDFDASDGLWWETSTAPDAIGLEPIHIYGDDGVFVITLRVTDDDNLTGLDTCNITVLNLDPTVSIESAIMDVEIGLRVAGRKYNNVSMTLFEEGNPIGNVSIERLPGSPDEQMAWIPYILDMTKTYSATVIYTPADPPNVGGNPVWIYIKFPNGTIQKIHHTFNVQQSKKRDSEHWNHVEPWEVDLNAHLIGHTFEITSHITDPGSDDETLTYSYGSQNVTVVYLSNPPNPDPYPSPEVNPRDIMDTTTLVYEGAGTLSLMMVDDDGGINSVIIDLG
ncbi:MAG: hypothetical protein JSV09_12745 [Thermoplasmata archaeon]|nr:MAG: hypothetical protein JSV09_12745 [Thermoplasmata archaeon]